MAIQNINAINYNLDELKEYTNEYILQSLSNLGQRLTIDDSGLTTNSFDIRSIYSAQIPTDCYNNPQNYVCKCKYNVISKSINIEILNKKNDYLAESTSIDTIEYTNILLTSEELELITPINNVTSYNSDALILNDDNYFKFSIFGIDELLEDTKGVGKNETEYTCIKVNKDDDKIINAIKLFEYNNETYCMFINYYNSSYNTEFVNNSQYLLFNNLYSNYYISNSSELENKYLLEIIKIENTELHDVCDFINNLYNIKNTSLTTTELREYIIRNYYDVADDLDTIKRYYYVLDYNTENNQYFSLTDNYQYTEFDILDSDNDDVDDTQLLYNYVNQNLKYLTNDLTTLYPYLYEYFNKNLISDENNGIKIYILYNLLTSIIEQSSSLTQLRDDYINDNINYEVVFWLPLDYTINYVAKQNDEYYILYGDNINVEFTTYNEAEIQTNLLDDLKQILVNDCEEKIITLRYIINYTDNDLISSIDVVRTFTYPYINENGYWVVNDSLTDIYAWGIDAGNPNIIISYNCTPSSDFQILSSIYRDYLLSLTPKSTTKTQIVIDRNSIDLNYDMNYSTGDSFTLNTYLPDLDSISTSYIPAVKNSLLMNISSINNCESDEERDILRTILGDNGVVVTFAYAYSYTYNKKEFLEYRYLNEPNTNNAYTLTTNYLVNSSQVMQKALSSYNYITPDNYLYTQLVFDPIKTKFKNNIANADDTINSYVFPNIKVNSSDYYATNSFKLTSFENKFNIGVEFDTVCDDYKTKQIKLVSQSETANNFIKIDDANELIYNFNNTEDDDTVLNYVASDSREKTDAIYEYYPRKNVPLLRLDEVLTTNINALNKYNIISLNENKVLYYSYLGTNYKTKNKNILTLGTSSYNANIGTYTLLSSDSVGKFRQQTQFDINIEKIYTNGRLTTNKEVIANSYITTNDYVDFKENTFTERTHWQKYYIDDKIIYNTTYTLVAQDDLNLNTIKIKNNSYTLSIGTAFNNSKVVLYSIYNTNDIYEYSTILHVDRFLKNNLGLNFDSTYNLYIKGPEELKQTNSEGLTKQSYYYSLNCNLATNENMVGDYYVLNPINVSYYAVNKNIYVNIKEVLTNNIKYKPLTYITVSVNK